MNRVSALLPIKANSERVTGKNFKLFGGRPLYQTILDTLLSVDQIRQVYINTDHVPLFDECRRLYGDKVILIQRPSVICGDNVPMNQIIQHDISFINDEHFIQTHTTNPLLRKETINKAINQYFEHLNSNDSLFSVTKIQSRLYLEDCCALNHDPKHLARTQDLPPIFEENSNIYIFSRNSFLRAKCRRIGLTPKMFLIDKLEAVDIDEPQDFILAESIFEKRREIWG